MNSMSSGWAAMARTRSGVGGTSAGMPLLHSTVTAAAVRRAVKRRGHTAATRADSGPQAVSYGAARPGDKSWRPGAPASAAERSQRLLDRHGSAGKGGRVAQRVLARFGAAQFHDQVEEVGDLVALEGDDELLVVQAEGVRGVDGDAGVGAADGDVLVHHALPLFLGQRVPGARLDEWIDEQVLAPGRVVSDAALRVLLAALKVDVDRLAQHRQIGVGLDQVPAEVGAGQVGVQGGEGVDLRAPHAQAEVAVAARAD